LIKLSLALTLLPGRKLLTFKIMFFRKSAFGLDISDYSIEALELEKKFGKLYLGAYGRIKLEKGIVKDGKILEKEKLKEKIKGLLNNVMPRRIKTKKVILSLPESKTFIHFFSAKENIEEQAAKTLPLEPEKAFDEYVEVLNGTGLKPLVIDIESSSLARAFRNEMIKDKGVLIADIGAGTTVLTIFDQGSVRY